MDIALEGFAAGLREGIAGVVAGRRCIICGRPAELLCRSCLDSLARPGARETPPGVDEAIVALAYDGAARRLMLDLKLKGQRRAAVPLGRALWRAALRAHLDVALLTWVPARRRDIRRRGFDHARALASEVAARTGLPIQPLLERVGRAPDQAGLGARERRTNLTGVFGGRDCIGSVGLVDDLVTSGATASACAAALKAAGAGRVVLLSACGA